MNETNGAINDKNVGKLLKEIKSALKKAFCCLFHVEETLNLNIHHYLKIKS